MSGWIRTEVDDWPETAELLEAAGRPWPRGAVRMDLRWWDDQVRQGLAKRIPNSKALAKRYGWTEWGVRGALRDEAWWQDGYRREDSAKAPRTSREPAANPETEERQESEANREPAAKTPRTRRENSATRAESTRARSTDHVHDLPAPNPRPCGPGASWVAKRAMEELSELTGAALQAHLDAYDIGDAGHVDRWHRYIRGKSKMGLDGRTRRERPEAGIPDGIRRRDIAAGLHQAAAEARARPPPAEVEADPPESDPPETTACAP